MKHPFIVPGSGYTNSLLDWDFWLTDLALRRIAAPGEMERYEKGCILNFLDHMDAAGRIPICILPKITAFEEYPGQKNIHKPCLAQHALFIAEQGGGCRMATGAVRKTRNLCRVVCTQLPA